jgi:hypothetical protein
MNKILPTDESQELAKNRIPLWLDPKDLKWLSEHCCCTENASEEEKDMCLRIRFRSSTALHKFNNK